MENNRELPEITFGGTSWLVDAAGFQFLEKGNLTNRIMAIDLCYTPLGYSFCYSKSRKTLAGDNEDRGRAVMPGDSIYVRIPQFVEIDKEGVALKYGLSPEELINKVDHEIMVDHQEHFKNSKSVRGVLADIVFESRRTTDKSVEEISLKDYVNDMVSIPKEALKDLKNISQKSDHQYADLEKLREEIYKRLEKMLKEILASKLMPSALDPHLDSKANNVDHKLAKVQKDGELIASQMRGKRYIQPPKQKTKQVRNSKRRLGR